jgi:hypothetical protein
LSETNIAARLKALITTPKAKRPIDSGKAIAWVQKQLAELPCEDFGVKISRVVLKGSTTPQLGGGNHLGNLEEQGITVFQMLLVGLEGLEGLDGLAVLV